MLAWRKNQSRIKNPSCGIYLDWSYLETDMEGASPHSRGGLFVYQIIKPVKFMKIKYLTIGVLLSLSSQVAFASIDVNLKYGQRHSAVTELQEFLIDKGFLNAQSSGYFGLLTLKAVQKYQSSVGVPSTGYVGVLTREKINKELSTILAPSTQAEAQEVKPAPVVQATTTITPTVPLYTPPVVTSQPVTPVYVPPTPQPQVQTPVTPTPVVVPTPVSRDPSLVATSNFSTQIVSSNSTGVKVASYTFDPGTFSQSITTNSIVITFAPGGVNFGDIKNVYIKSGNSIVGSTLSGLVDGKAVFSFANIGITDGKTFDVYADIGATTGTLKTNMRLQYRYTISNMLNTLSVDGATLEVK